MRVINFQKLCPNAISPTKGTIRSGWWDIYSIENVTIPLSCTRIIRTGLRIQIPTGYKMTIDQKSGLAAKGIVPLGGRIDEDYRGEWKVILANIAHHHDFHILSGQKIAQISIERDETKDFDFQEIESIDTTTSRGEGGFGSTGA